MATSDIRQQKLEIIESSRQQERSKCLLIAFHSISQAVISEYCSFSKLSRCAIQGADFSRLNQGTGEEIRCYSAEDGIYAEKTKAILPQIDTYR